MRPVTVADPETRPTIDLRWSGTSYVPGLWQDSQFSGPAKFG